MEGGFDDIAWPDNLVLPWLKAKTETPQTPATAPVVTPGLHERILGYLATIPGAISGNGGDQQTFTVACTLTHGFALSADEALGYLEMYNGKCEPPWTEKELRHKLDMAIAETRHEKPRGHLLGVTLKIKKKDGNMKRPRDGGDDWEEPPDSTNSPAPAYFYKDFDFSAPVEPDEGDEGANPFPLDAFPPEIQAPVKEIMRHYGVKASLPAMVAMSINSTAIGRGITVMSNVGVTYANTYTLIGADSGTGKSVTFKDLSSPIFEMQNENLNKFLNEEKPRIEAQLKLLEREINQLLKDKAEDTDVGRAAREQELTELFQEQSKLHDQLESSYRFASNDFTSEALGKLLASSGEQMAVLSDEGGTAIYNMQGRYAKGNATDDVFLNVCKTVSPYIIDRSTRAPIVLTKPCVALLLMIQPDLLKKVFSDERLVIGGFLARCLFFDSRMQVQFEEEKNLPPPDTAVMGLWDKYIRGLVEAFRLAEDTIMISVDPDVRAVSRNFKNEIVTTIRGELADVKSFAIRWCEQAWEIALNFHVATYSIDCYRHSLSVKTFNNAIKLVRWFIKEELHVLQISRNETLAKNKEKIEAIFDQNGGNAEKLRDFCRRHRIEKEDVISCVKNYPNAFGLTTFHRQSGGTPSIILFLANKPPPGWAKNKAK